VTALDTNVLVRIVVDDDEQQVQRAHAFLAAQDRVFISRTVLHRAGLGIGRLQVSAIPRDDRIVHSDFVKHSKC
jgi:predicted nucleic acid-binding protein